MFKISIEKTVEKETKIGHEWSVVGQEVEEGVAKDVWGYTPRKESTKVTTEVVYSQVIEDEDYDLIRAIAALNGLQPPIKQ